MLRRFAQLYQEHVALKGAEVQRSSGATHYTFTRSDIIRLYVMTRVAEIRISSLTLKCFLICSHSFSRYGYYSNRQNTLRLLSYSVVLNKIGWVCLVVVISHKDLTSPGRSSNSIIANS